MNFSWDLQKAKINFDKHQVDFADVVGVFEDEYSLYQPDFSNSYNEERFVVIGMDFLGRILTVVYTYQKDKIRIISARKSTKTERKSYESQRI